MWYLLHKNHTIIQKFIVKKSLKIPPKNNIEVMRSISGALGTLKYKLLKGVKTNKKKIDCMVQKNILKSISKLSC